MFKLKIGQKILLLLLAIALIPLSVINIYWLRSSQYNLRKDAAARQNLLTTHATEQVNQFISSKIDTLIIYSQTDGIQKFDVASASQNLTMLIKQDSDLERVALVDNSGQEKVALDNEGANSTLQNVKNSDEFKAATFLSGKEYISGVNFDKDQQPSVFISVPLITFETRQELSKLSTSEPGVVRSPTDIKGILIAKISLNNLWTSVLSQRLGTNGYAYIVDPQGRLIAHQDKSTIQKQPDLRENKAVNSFINNPNATGISKQTTSMTGQAVLSTYRVVPRTGWGVIAEEPLSSIYASASRETDVFLFIFGSSLTLVVLLSIFVSRQFTRPIKQLAEHASMISRGNLNSLVTIKSTDELGVLASAFNAMTSNIQGFIKSIKAESTKLNVVLNSVREGIIAIDGNGNIVVANIAASTIIGKLPQDIAGQPVSSMFPWTKNNQIFQINLSSHEVNQEVILSSQNQQRHYLELIVSKIENDPTGIQAIITFRDKTEEKELEIMKVDFVSMAAHELRTPMTSIRGYLSLIAKDDSEVLSATTRHYLERAQTSSQLLIGLINNLLNVSKIERGSFSMNLAQVDCHKLIDEAVNDQQMAAKEKDIILTYAAKPQAIYVLADKMAILEVINNLISNALHYTHPKGHVSVDVIQAEREAIISVKDDGAGIASQAQKHLFTKFYRVRDGLDSGSGGSGLGLYICKSIVELHKGKIWLDSQEGKGSTFSFSLPIYDKVDGSDISSSTSDEGVTKSRGWITKSLIS